MENPTMTRIPLKTIEQAPEAARDFMIRRATSTSSGR